MQPALDIEPVFDPTSRDALRAAYDEGQYARHGVSFEDALQNKGLAIALRLHAEAIARRVNQPH